jgi:hypothetical protein
VANRHRPRHRPRQPHPPKVLVSQFLRLAASRPQPASRHPLTLVHLRLHKLSTLVNNPLLLGTLLLLLGTLLLLLDIPHHKLLLKAHIKHQVQWQGQARLSILLQLMVDMARNRVILACIRVVGISHRRLLVISNLQVPIQVVVINIHLQLVPYIQAMVTLKPHIKHQVQWQGQAPLSMVDMVRNRVILASQAVDISNLQVPYIQVVDISHHLLLVTNNLQLVELLRNLHVHQMCHPVITSTHPQLVRPQLAMTSYHLLRSIHPFHRVVNQAVNQAVNRVHGIPILHQIMLEQHLHPS